MECPKCGFVLDALTVDCPRCARLKAEGNTPTQAGPLRAPLAHGGTFTRPHSMTAGKRPITTSASFGAATKSVKQIFGILGGLLLLISIFIPAIKIPSLGGISLWNIAAIFNKAVAMTATQTIPAGMGGAIFFIKSAAVIFLILGLAAIIVSIARAYSWQWLPAGGAVAYLGFGIIAISKAVATIKGMSPAGSEPSASVATSNASPAWTSFIGFGVILLFIAIVTLVVSACIPAEEEF
jgi:hypothetical protein